MSDESKKPRSDSVLDNLPQNQQEQVEHWLFDEKPRPSYKKIRERLADDFNVRVSESTLCEWRKGRAKERNIAKIIGASRDAKRIQQIMQENPAESFELLLKQLGVAAFELSASGEELGVKTMKDLAEIAALGLKAKTDRVKIQQKEREIQLAFEKFKQELKTDLEKGFDALYQEVKGNKEAADLFNRFKAIVTKATAK